MLVESIKIFFNLTECRRRGLKMSWKSINIPDMFYHQRTMDPHNECVYFFIITAACRKHPDYKTYRTLYSTAF